MRVMRSNPLAEPETADRDDAGLVARARDGDREALEQLVSRHQRWIYNLVLRMVYLPQDAEDATQEILIRELIAQFVRSVRLQPDHVGTQASSQSR